MGFSSVQVYPDERIMKLLVTFSLLSLTRLQCCGISSYQDWTGLADNIMETDCFVPQTCFSTLRNEHLITEKRDLYDDMLHFLVL